jgi:hypothetical protein
MQSRKVIESNIHNFTTNLQRIYNKVYSKRRKQRMHVQINDRHYFRYQTSKNQLIKIS